MSSGDKVNCGTNLGTFVTTGLGALSGTLLVNHFFLNKQSLSQGQIAVCGLVALQGVIIGNIMFEIIDSAATGKAETCKGSLFTLEGYLSIALFLYVLYAAVKMPETQGKGVVPGMAGALVMSNVLSRLAF